MRTLAATFDSIPGDVVVRIQTSVGFSEREIDAAVAATHFAVLNSPGVSDAITSFDFDTRQITVTVTGSTKVVRLDVGALNDVASRAVRAAMAYGELGSDAVNVRVVGPTR